MTLRNIIALILVLVSFVLLIPGLTADMVTIKANLSIMGVETELFRETRSILQTVEGLHESGNDFVAGLILLFSVLVPFIKGALLAVAAALKKVRLRLGIAGFVRSISKWAMADVFVVGVYIAYLSARATDNLDAELHAGFYWFAGYCLVSLLALQFMKLEGESVPVPAERWTGPSEASAEPIPVEAGVADVGLPPDRESPG
ncbi:MAG: paraquat-inducible protein A [Gemmatimonadota bacterium]|nr:paraquat-inducible protein A [Gemmatimonadota bacterium]